MYLLLASKLAGISDQTVEVSACRVAPVHMMRFLFMSYYPRPFISIFAANIIADNNMHPIFRGTL